MSIHEYSWAPMNIHEPSWIFMRAHEYSWYFMNIHEISWILMSPHEYSLALINIHGISWIFMRYHEYSWGHYGTWRFSKKSKTSRTLCDQLRLDLQIWCQHKPSGIQWITVISSLCNIWHVYIVPHFAI